MALDIFEKDFIRDVKFIKEELIDEAEVGVKTIKNTDDKQGVVDKLVDMFKKDNSLFDEDKFRNYIEK